GLKPALKKIARYFGEPAKINQKKIKSHDNDLGVDVIASPMLVDESRIGGLFILLQCTTSPAIKLKSKMEEDYNLFSSVWEDGFMRETCIRGGATPEDLLKMEQKEWVRMCNTGLVLD